MKNPLLSICIATYNRAKYIGKTLESIIPQVTDEVEIVIVDGASTDNTSNVVEGYASACEQLRYIRLPAKGGVDQDYCKAVEYAQGEMCWLFTDDDLLKPSAIRTVLNEAQKGYSLIVVNAQLMNIDFSREIANRLLQIQKNEIYSVSELGELFQRVIMYISFIGCVVINRDLWMQREKERYFGTEFIHVGVIFQTFLPAPALVIAEPHISIRYGNAQWSQRAFEIGMFKWPALISSFEHISEKIKQKHDMSKPWRRFQRIIIYRAKGEYSLRKYLKCVASKDSSLWWEIAAFIIAITPSSLLNFILLSYLKTMRKDKLITIYDFENNKHNICNLFRRKNI
jgi:glycosyltransferase involved in cell wall biosynthesis